jgi:hypothetical protein
MFGAALLQGVLSFWAHTGLPYVAMLACTFTAIRERAGVCACVGEGVGSVRGGV